ncbi:MAG: diadenylate cyclase CdaA [Oscillospiraceae bacterium]|nr:diadenylate cyclase CdaA [Oscillospiraceae bacterium]
MEVIQNFFQTLTRMQWSDYLDILLVALLINRLLPLIRSSRTMRIARTVAALVLLAWITKSMNLHTLSWILNEILAIGILAFVVLFQPELRLMLDKLGDVKITNLFATAKTVPEMENVINQTVKACIAMSEKKTGALIVFERNDSLDSVIREGVPIDACVTEQLLRTIFFVNTALHDKAVVISKGRIAAARCKLPEATGSVPTVLSKLGTRHNSAVGMSQHSDAVVVVVSEETGTVSVAVNNMLKQLGKPEELEMHLRKELGSLQAEEQPQKGAVKVLKKITGQEKEDSYEKK